MNIHEALAGIVQRTENYLTFNILEIGSLPSEESPEPFHSLIHSFPGSRINAFEVDAELCKTLNSKAISGFVHHPIALGRREEERPFYITNHPMCCSLYKPNEKLLERFNNMEMSMLKAVSTIKTVSLDYFTAKNNIGPVDFIKIDIQGAELDVFRGGVTTLRDVVAIVTEVEFIHLYENQPLFGDVSAFLAEQGLSFNKFLEVGGRALKPTILDNNPNLPGQFMWSDSLFLKDPMHLDTISSDQLLKQAVLALMYGCPDVSLYCFMEYDRRHSTTITRELLLAFAGTSDRK
jgi:FkbM family methyltransferase